MGNWEQSIGLSDEYYTPPEIFDAMGCEFDLDVAAPKDRANVHVPAKKFITENSLDLEWNGFIWNNPPFGGRNGITTWLNKAILQGNGISLTPDRTSVTWWHTAANGASAILFVHGKIKFIRPDGTRAKQPTTGTTLFAFGERAVEALYNAERKSLGIVRVKTK